MQTHLSLDYIFREPLVQTQNAPAIILIHGYGSNEADLFSFATELPKQAYIISVKAPYAMVGNGNAWYAISLDENGAKWSDNAQAAKSRDLIATFIDEITQEYPIDAKNITLIGFSQGCILSHSVALTYPEKVKNIIGLSGYINTEIIPLDTADKNYSHLQVYASHGSVDQVIPVAMARPIAGFLEKHGIAHVYEEYAVGHGVAPQNFYSFRNWLEKRI